VRPIDLSPGEAVLHEGDPRRCAVVLPGVRYFSQAPLLWFAREAAGARGWSVLEVSERAPAGEEPFAWMVDRAGRALDATDADTVAVIGKSLGSAAAPMVSGPAIWLTPLLTRPEIAGAIGSASAPTLLIGSPDDPSWGDGVESGGPVVKTLEIGGLDHSLQVRGDPGASLAVLREVTARVSSFLAERAGSP
jgi:hypothetical protein